MTKSVVHRYLNQEIIIELFPTVVFFLTNFVWGFRAATIAVIIATVISVALGYLLKKRVPLIAVATLAIVLSLGAASLYFNDETFVKVKPTVGKCLFASALLVGLLLKPSFLERVLSSQISLTAAGWRMLTYAWIAFALTTAIVNEVVWRNMSTDNWVLYKTIEDPVSIVGYIAITRLIAQLYWDIETETP